MIEPPPGRPSPRQAVEWVVRALNAEGLSFLLCGKGTLDLQAEYTGSVDTDILAGRDAQSVLRTLDEYSDRGDLVLAWADPGATVRYLVRGWSAVDVIPADPVDPDLYGLLQRSGSTVLSLGSAGEVRRSRSSGGFFRSLVLADLRPSTKDGSSQKCRQGSPCSSVSPPWSRSTD